MHKDLLGRDDMAQDRSAIVKKLESIAQVNTGGAIVEQASTQVVTAFDGTLDGKIIYDNACMSCHLSGLAGAPKLVAADWTNRMANGMEALITNSINGKGAMPPRGGRMDLSDEQMKVVVEFMVRGF